MSIPVVQRKKLCYQRVSGSSLHCCVPRCSCSLRYNSTASFHRIPANNVARQQWLAKIRRVNFSPSKNTRVCSRHFLPEDLVDTPGGRRWLKRGAIPILFEWNNYSLPEKRPGVWDRRPPEESAAADPHVDSSESKMVFVPPDHDYCIPPITGVMANELQTENAALHKRSEQLQSQVEGLQLRIRFGLERFAGSDDEIRFYTRFASYDLLMRFWTIIEPSLPSMISVRQGQRGTPINSTPSTHSLQPIDELFLFLNYLALGSKQQDLADRYGVHLSTVSWIITAWTNYLFIVLGSIRIWIPEDHIRTNLPSDFKDYPDTTVILSCTELRCQCPSSPVLQSEFFSFYKSHCTLKGLIGIAPHGAVTFISGLYTGSISDKQITRESGLLTLLKPGMAVMVNRGFLIDEIVPCKVYRPAFLSGRSQMSAGEVRETQATARLKVHVERLLRRVKEHKLFDSEIPLAVFGIINQLYTVACLLTNYENGPLVKAWAKKPDI